jgi:hypothetical protein
MVHSELEDFDDGDEEYDVVEDDSEDSEPTIDCPYCGKEILEATPRCPYCERYISEEDSPPRKKTWLIFLGSALCLYVVYRWIAG